MRLGRRAQLLAGASVVYNAVEAIVAIAAGAVAGSIALIGFGLDSVIEVSSGLVILWQFKPRAAGDRANGRRCGSSAVSFFALAAYVTVESLRALVGGGSPDSSPVGIGLAAASLVVMPLLSWAQRRTGRALGSGSVVADSKQTLLCTYLSAVLLVGLVLNATLGWSWADPLAGLVIAAVALKEGIEAWRGDTCCDEPGHGSAVVRLGPLRQRGIGPHGKRAELGERRRDGGESRARRRQLVQPGEVLHHGDARAEQQAVRRPSFVGDVVDVDRVDADQARAVLDEPARSGLGEERRFLAYCRGSPVGVTAGMQQHGAAGHLGCRERADVDGP